MRQGSPDFKQDSDIIHLDVGGMPVIVLHSFEACFDLLERRSKEYSSRYGASSERMIVFTDRAPKRGHPHVGSHGMGVPDNDDEVR